jgi:hypothetical protein
MDEFGVLTERFGLKQQGKAAPMVASKRPTSSSNAQPLNFGFDSGLNPKPSSSSSSRSPPHSNTRTQSFGGFDDYSDLLFGGPKKPTKQSDSSFDYDSIFSRSSSETPSSLPIYDDDDVFGGFPGLKSSATANNDSVFASFASPPKQSDPIDDLLGNLGGVEAKPKSPSRNRSVKSASDFDDLIPGFGGSSPPNYGYVNIRKEL